MENVENEKTQELQERSDISKNSQEEQEGKITETERTGSGDTNAKTEVAKDCTNLYPNDDSSTNDSSFVSHRLSTNPSYTQEEATAIAVLKELRLAKNVAIQRLRKAYAETLADTQPNVPVGATMVMTGMHS
ncbi:hypothetical protein, partial [Helicobacter rodentium]|uniref:hypothetical protein n=1 Tax=Helicobacter rodentium TaxID=59617 RepID=UPI002633B62D